MKIENKLEQMKKVYQETSVSDEQMIQEWQLLEGMLGEQHHSSFSPLLFRAFAFATVILLLSGGVVVIAQASKPGEFLYPVKEVSQKAMEDVKQSIPVFNNVTLTPKPSPSSLQNDEKQTVTEKVNDENQLRKDDQRDTVKGVSDEVKGNSDEEKNKNSSWNNAGGNSEEKEGRKGENNGNNHSGSDNSNNNNQSENEEKGNSPNSEKVDKNNSENHGSAISPQGQGKSDKNTSKN